MAHEIKNFIFCADEMMYDIHTRRHYIKFINSIPQTCFYFFTHNCSISRKELKETLLDFGIDVSLNSVLTPNYLLLGYCKKIYSSFSVYPIVDNSYSHDFYDFHIHNIEICDKYFDLICLSTTNLDSHHKKLIQNSTIPIVFSSNLCKNRRLDCTRCDLECYISFLKLNYKSRLIIPDAPPFFNTFLLFKNLNLNPSESLVITNRLKYDYSKLKEAGSKMALILKNDSISEYLTSPYDADIVVDDLDNLLYFLNIIEKA
ncbi:hypothetical protein N072000002_01630 [Clostridium tetani]|uniref:Uncharacterized protein n=1 Tax=Clostridium tetani TaxID=1513 RepID=A0A4V1LEN6_CLOTA|nr:hypothetical protein [Clostridium tetani]RXI48595.1 hypothetical protein DP130_07645 [Clostridium tetani]RXM71838.1 hypothetical protein DP139_02070 [Clostridium tetani]BDR65932.1 hypothetical protein K144312032_01600 [Clostridium tetani]BDR79916.1 hypothetical protein K234311028_01620 [Clostridium tetani]BDR88362.1 hypothetical protein N072000002_01630 [Clostridium tetani]